MSRISNFKSCYGCGVCATVCAKQAITIQLNQRGFYVPIIDDSKCTNCGLCAEVCSFAYNDIVLKDKRINAYGAWSNDSCVRQRCSSGGVGYELGKYLITNGYKVCGVRYDSVKHRAEHYIATDETQLMYSIGSKYIQSYTVDAFKTINRKGKYLITGTPCQIDSFRRYIRKFNVENNFILMDFFCHSVPSMLAWKKYLQIVEQKTGPIVYASWRNKFTGWHDSWAMAIDGESDFTCLSDKYNIYKKEDKHKYNSRLSEGDLFYRLFLGDYCCNPACQKNCKFKYDKSSADIRIGDFWGKTYANNDEGVSAVVAFTDIGHTVLKQLNCTLIEHPLDVIAEGQMRKNVGRAYTSWLVLKCLKNKRSTFKTFKRIFVIERILNVPRRILNLFVQKIWKK